MDVQVDCSVCFFFKQKTAYDMRISDWSSDVCSSDLTSRVLAGTIRRTGDDERDLALAATLARSSKDLEEHEYAVRSVAEALEPHCSSMNVPEAPFVLHLPNVMRLATDVRSEEHTSELQSLMRISYAVFCLKKNYTFRRPNSHNSKITDHKHSSTSLQTRRE